jgi:hypothetical protein
MKNITYREVGEQAGLSGSRLNLYVAYMKARWEDDEKQKCLDGYARKWSLRFLGGVEYSCSDEEGKYILRDLAGVL